MTALPAGCVEVPCVDCGQPISTYPAEDGLGHRWRCGRCGRTPTATRTEHPMTDPQGDPVTTSDLDAWLADYQPMEVEVAICGRADLIAAHAEADLALLAAGPENNEAERQRVADIEAQMEASLRVFKLRGIGNQAWQDLKKAHPPTDAQRREGLDTDMTKFVAPALVACSADDPPMTLDQAQHLLRRLPPGEADRLFEGVLQVNGRVAGKPSSAAAVLLESLPTTDSPAAEESAD